MTSQNSSFERVSLAPPIGGVYPRVARLEVAGISTKLVFVHHLGRCKELTQWHQYLQTEHADLMDWLGAEFYTTLREA